MDEFGDFVQIQTRFVDSFLVLILSLEEVGEEQIPHIVQFFV
jgi:hypothetical protein